MCDGCDEVEQTATDANGVLSEAPVEQAPQEQQRGIDVFGLGSVTVGTPGPVRVEGEEVGLVNWNSASGVSFGRITAAGLATGGNNNYIGGFTGVETMSNSSETSIATGQGSGGLEIPLLGGVGVGAGFYATGNGGIGVFVFAQGGVLGNYLSLGVGVGW